MTEKELITACKKGDRKAQKALYDRYAPVLLGIARRYVKNTEDAEDVLVEGFFKIMTKLDMYSGNGSFEGWMKRIVVNESLMFLRKRGSFKADVELENVDAKDDTNIEDDLLASDILNVLDDLPTGYRTVFNMYVIEGYKHREIAEILNISINTSKSQLILAKKKMQVLLKNLGLQYKN